MDKLLLNGSKLSIFDQTNSQSGSIQYTQSKLKIVGNATTQGVLISGGKLGIKDQLGTSTCSIIYSNNVVYISGNSTNAGLTINDGLINLRDPATLYTASIWFTNPYIYTNRTISMSALAVSSSGLVNNLNADMLDGYHYNTIPHNSLSGLQGSSSATTFYHLTQQQYQNKIRQIYVSSSAPDNSMGVNGDIWIQI